MRSNRGHRFRAHVDALGSKVDVFCLQETWQKERGLFPLSHPSFFVFRCDVPSSSVAKHGVAVAIRKSFVQPQSRPSIVVAYDARCIVVEFVDLWGRTRRVASLYFPADGPAERLAFMAALPWPILATAFVGCDSNLKTSGFDYDPVRASHVPRAACSCAS
jgi:exonuclease III